MTMENSNHEWVDVSPIRNGDFPGLAMLVFHIAAWYIFDLRLSDAKKKFPKYSPDGGEKWW